MSTRKTPDEATKAAERIMAAKYPAQLSHHDAHVVARALLSTKQEGEDNIPPEEDDRMSPHLTGGGTLRRSAVPDEGCDPAYGSWFVVTPSSPVSPTPEERDAVLEEAATLMRWHFDQTMVLAKEYKSDPHDDGSHAACLSEAMTWQDAERAIRALKHPADVAGEDNSGAGAPPLPSTAEKATHGALVQCVRCIDSDGDVVHIFSSKETLQKFLDADERSHVIYDYVIDCPERMEQVQQ